MRVFLGVVLWFGWTLESAKWGKKDKTHHVVAEHEHFPQSFKPVLTPLHVDGLSNHVYKFLLNKS
jgi:hypothetical protein